MSGGPWVDTAGHIWAIQSQTIHYSLGFQGTLKDASGKTITEHQFLNAGLGADVDEIVKLTAANGVGITIAA